MAIPGFIDGGGEAQCLHDSDPLARTGTVVDLSQFGSLEAEDGTFRWPQEADIVMKFAAFEDMFNSSVNVEIATEQAIPIASLPGLAILKLFAWLTGRMAGTWPTCCRSSTPTEMQAKRFAYMTRRNKDSKAWATTLNLSVHSCFGKDGRRLTQPNTRKVLITKRKEIIERLLGK